MEDRTLLSPGWFLLTTASPRLAAGDSQLNAATGAASTIDFNIAGSGVHLIVLSPLPEITSPVLIDLLQPGYAAPDQAEQHPPGRVPSGSLAITRLGHGSRPGRQQFLTERPGTSSPRSWSDRQRDLRQFPRDPDPTGFQADNEEGPEVDGGAEDIIGTSGTGSMMKSGNLLGNSSPACGSTGKAQGQHRGQRLIGTSVTGDLELPNGQQTPYGTRLRPILRLLGRRRGD